MIFNGIDRKRKRATCLHRNRVFASHFLVIVFKIHTQSKSNNIDDISQNHDNWSNLTSFFTHLFSFFLCDKHLCLELFRVKNEELDVWFLKINSLTKIVHIIKLNQKNGKFVSLCLNRMWLFNSIHSFTLHKFYRIDTFYNKYEPEHDCHIIFIFFQTNIIQLAIRERRFKNIRIEERMEMDVWA